MQSYLTVKKVKELLADAPEDALVVLALDAEGNTFSPANSYTAAAKYVEGRRTWDQGFLYTSDEPEFESQRGRRAVVLWPTH